MTWWQRYKWPLVGALAIYFLYPRKRGTLVSTKMPIPKVQAWEKDLILGVFEKHGFPRREADTVIGLESGWNPSALNPGSGAAGLIQFTPGTLQRMGYHGRPFQQLSAVEQMPYIDQYLSRVKRWKVPGDTYMAIIAPAFIGVPDDTVVYPVGGPAWRQNPTMREGELGPITARSIRNRIRGRA